MTTTDTTTDPPTQTWPTLPDGRYAVLRCCNTDGTNSHGFTWPLNVGATVVAPDWDPDPGRDCGGGLHGLLWGCGDGGLLTPTDGVWMVVAVDPADIATPHTDAIPDKVRFRACEIVHVGDQASAVGWLAERAPGLPIAYGTSTSGDRGTSTSGAYGMLVITHWDGKAYRRKIAEVDGDTIKAGVAYRLDADGNFVEADR